MFVIASANEAVSSAISKSCPGVRLRPSAPNVVETQGRLEAPVSRILKRVPDSNSGHNGHCGL